MSSLLEESMFCHSECLDSTMSSHSLRAVTVEVDERR